MKPFIKYAIIRRHLRYFLDGGLKYHNHNSAMYHSHNSAINKYSTLKISFLGSPPYA